MKTFIVFEWSSALNVMLGFISGALFEGKLWVDRAATYGRAVA
jgi:hypothetical protein